MKKLLLCLFLAIAMIITLVACGTNGTKDNPDESNKEVEKDAIPEIIPAEKVNPRDVVVDYMYEMANIEWIPKSKIDFSEDIIETLIYEPGTKYTGIMYVTGNNCMRNAEQFKMKLDENGVYTGPTDRVNAWGNHCSSAIRVAYDLISRDVKFGSTVQMFPTQNKGTIQVGEYTIAPEDIKTEEVISRNDKNTMYESYALLKKGDCVLYNWEKTGHVRMIISVEVVRNKAGKINPSQSYITTIEQTSSFDKTDKANGKNTTWFIEHVYPFNDLINTNYIPVTIPALEVEDAQDTEFTTKSLDKAETITSGKLKGIIRSSYAAITSATVEISDASGKSIATQTYKNSGDPQVFQFSNAKAPEEFTTLTAGNYVYTVTADTIYGSAKVYQLEFTIE